MLKKLGVDRSNQWIIYDEQFEMFFAFLSDNITDANILTEREAWESEQLKDRGEWLPESERMLKMNKLKSENSGLNKYTNQDVKALAEELKSIKETTKDYSILCEQMQ